MLTELLQAHNNNIIINSDLDGFLCGLLLHNYFGSNVIGFSNSVDTIWIDNSVDAQSIHNAIYVDMFVANDNVATIDNHIIAANEEHWHMLKQNANKINPNLLINEPRYFTSIESYKSKYAFSTFHFLCALVEKETGLRINFDFDKQIGKTMKLGDLLVKVDKTMVITLSDYTLNARFWWRWVRSISPNGVINDFINYLGNLPKDKKKIKVMDKEISHNLMNGRYLCESKDGGYKKLMVYNKYIKSCAKSFIETLANVTGLSCFPISDLYKTYKGGMKRIQLVPERDDEIINEIVRNQSVNGEKIFSYSFVMGPNSSVENFSYTTFVSCEKDNASKL